MASQHQIAIIGAGNMGSGIAQKYAACGYLVTLVDKDDARLKKGRDSIEKALQSAVKRNLYSEAETQEILSRIRSTDKLADCRDASLIVEAIFEDLHLKQRLFVELEHLCARDAILATNTSSFKVEDIFQPINHKHRAIGLHYFFPPAKNRLVELISTDRTHGDITERARTIQEDIKKVVIVSKDSPGFIVNRFFVPWLNEAMRIVAEQEANIATVEHAAKAFFNIGMGPFELMNVTGLPITFHASTALANSLGSFYAPCPLINNYLEKNLTFDLSGPIHEEKVQAIGLRMLTVVAIISSQMVFDEHVCSEHDADLGARTGLMWPKGPLALFREHGNLISAYVRNHPRIGEGLSIPNQFKDILAS